jgi:predicted nucleotidyltransferase
MSTADFSAEGFFYQLGYPPVRVDIFMGIPGLKFEQAWEQRVEVDFNGLVVKFISRENLITLKRASGRPQDLIDADLLSNQSEE